MEKKFKNICFSVRERRYGNEGECEKEEEKINLRRGIKTTGRGLEVNWE